MSINQMRLFDNDESDKGSEEGTELSQFLSTQEETKRAVERNAIDRGVRFIGIIIELKIDDLLNQVKELATKIDKEDIRESANALNINIEALKRLDNADPPMPYPYYFCMPEFLVAYPELAFYYRNIAMLSAKVMSDIGLDTKSCEAGQAPTQEKATEIIKYLNGIISGLIINTGVTPVTPNRHIEMLLANLGDSLGGSSRNEVGRVAMAQVMRPLIKHLYRHDLLESITYNTRKNLDPKTARDKDTTLAITPGIDLETLLNEIETKYVKYKELRLKNGVQLLMDKNIRWYGRDNKVYTPSADMHSTRENIREETEMIWGAEVKGGADPAGSDEHWKTASRALSRILEEAKKSGHDKPPLSFIGTTIVMKVALEIKEWLNRDDLISVYNLTKMIEQPEQMQRFLDDMMVFLGYSQQPQKRSAKLSSDPEEI